MNPRFYPLLLTIALLLGLNACSTTGSRPAADVYTEQGLPTQTDTTDREFEEQSYDVRRESFELSLAELGELSRSISSYQPELALEIVRSLESVPSGQLITMIDSQLYDPEFTEWLELALQLRLVLINKDSVSTAAHNWANYHYGHVVTQANFPDLVSRYASFFPAPSQVAILLPAEGGLAAAGQAIRDGILSAYLEQPGGSAIRFYSSGDNSESAIRAYQQAREDGATHWVAPSSRACW